MGRQTIALAARVRKCVLASIARRAYIAARSLDLMHEPLFDFT